MLRTIRLAAAASAVFSFGLATQASATLNLHSSTTVECIGAGGACDVLRFTLNIPDPQVPVHSDVPAVPGATYSDFGIGEFSLERLNGAGWNFGSIVTASPGTWNATTTGGSVFIAGNSDYPNAPIVFEIAVTGLTDLSDFEVMYGASGPFATGPVAGGGTATTHNWSTNGLVSSTVPEPASMILLGTGLMGLAGAARRRRRGNDVENA